jgi:hypothetical protein
MKSRHSGIFAGAVPETFYPAEIADFDVGPNLIANWGSRGSLGCDAYSGVGQFGASQAGIAMIFDIKIPDGVFAPCIGAPFDNSPASATVADFSSISTKRTVDFASELCVAVDNGTLALRNHAGAKDFDGGIVCFFDVNSPEPAVGFGGWFDNSQVGNNDRLPHMRWN